MVNFNFTAPTRIVFGAGAENDVGKYAAALGADVLIHYGGGSSARSGLLAGVTASLERAGIKYTPLGGVKANPVLSLVKEGIALCRQKKLTGILAVGGGSVLDSAKAIAVGVPYDGDVWDFFAGTAEIKAALPVGAILTLSAAGSEASLNAVVTNENGMLKRGIGSELIYPVFSVCNPELTYSVSAYQTACGVSDINAHVLERYFSNTADVDLSDRMCEAVLKTTMRAAGIALAAPDNYAARADIMWAGTVAHNNILGVGRVQDWASHTISHEISAVYDTAHGAALAIIFPAWMKYVYKANPRVFLQFANRVMGVDYYKSEEEAILEGIARYEKFLAGMGLSVRLSGLKLPESCVRLLADRFKNIGKVGRFMPLSAADIEKIYQLAY
ncbi:MAG: iron-containing alcohol dehydrogenase [Clostridiales bacterium]|jgi:alcohol dehydrogenase YqhD (iron-dependent ADH family)|nr:iron-containing alcohol dehydrogenase [Clostridiales bacterium]